MSDTDFTYQYVPDGYSHRAQRIAVLYPLVAPCRSPHGIEMATNKLLGIWRMRLTTLAECGWERLCRTASIQQQAVRNCRPSFAKARPVSWCCRLLPCPFCYARRVGDLWNAFERIFHEETGGSPKWYRPSDASELLDDAADVPARCRLKLLERTVAYRVTYQTENEDRELRLSRLLASIAALRTKALPSLQTVGGWQQTTVEPGRHKWRVKTRQLLVYREGDTIPPELLEAAPHRKISVHELPTRAVLAKAIGRACRYPELWMRSEPTSMVLLLQTMKTSRAKLTATFGALRSAVP